MKQTEATGRVRLAIARLASAYPLHAGILAQWHLVEDGSVATLCIGMADDRLQLRFNPAFVAELTLDEVCGVVHHEANHVLFAHVLHQPEPGENRRARVIAEEVTANEWVAEPLPGEPILLADFSYLPANEDTATRYDLLVRRTPLPDRPTIDDHGSWSEITEDPILGEDVIRMAVGTAWDALTDDEKMKVDQVTAEQASKLCGNSTLNAESATLAGGHASVPWQTVLRRYARTVVSVRPIYGRPPRRYPHLVGVLPGKARLADRRRIMACIDTSGSLSDQSLADISAELARLGRVAAVTVVECDTVIHRVYPYTKPVTSVMGRGGTDLRPPFAPDFLRRHRPDLVLYFTDGCGPAPENPPRIPVVWVLTPSGQMPCKWGRKVRING
jgi:predicted metal-dependent peptidase